jgi:predicted  nucleic acid-binding Zn-ribbon protein
LKYNEVLSDQSNIKPKSYDYEEYYKLTFQVSELKGKLSHKEEYIQNLLHEQSNIHDEYRKKQEQLNNENNSLKESLVKYEILKEKMDKFMSKNEEFQSLKSKYVKLENHNQELEEKMTRLRNFVEFDKGKFLKNVEDLTLNLEREKTKTSELSKEVVFYKERILKVDAENKKLIKQIFQQVKRNI